MAATLEIENLTLSLVGGRGEPVDVVIGVDLAIERGRTHALVGESGSGKSLTSLAVLGLLPPAIEIRSGVVRLGDDDLRRAGPARLRGIRGRRIGVVFQEPMTALNPLLPIGEQIAETLVAHGLMGWAAARARAVELLTLVGIPAAAERAGEYPHRFSGGMRQRVMIAIAIACEPELLIADEPTTALDVTMQAQILDLLGKLRDERGLALLFITHDLALVSEFADDVSVMYAGRIVERAAAADLFGRPRHPYTAGLLGSLPRVEAPPGGRLPVIPGDVPRPEQRPAGCAFHPRCGHPARDDTCGRAVPAFRHDGGRWVACPKSSAAG
ncbi:MAG: ABC transporter ATP-binding protein [Phycisphaerales bacterium]|nr:ABC transporter ATP-binding protein [Phycisphaerales bacterium]